MICKHVKIKATEQELKNNCGISDPDILSLLLSKRAFAVQRVRFMGHDDRFRTRVYLVDPTDDKRFLWVYSEYVTEVL